MEDNGTCCIVDDLLCKSFNKRTLKEQHDIVHVGRPTPDLVNLVIPMKSCVRHFKVRQYVANPWLTACSKLNKLFCWPCLLFTTEKTVWSKCGFDDLNNLSTALTRHGGSQKHLISMIKIKTFASTYVDRVNDCELNGEQQIAIKQHNDRVRRNRQFLELLIRVTCHLGMHEWPFSARGETSETNKGCYVDTVNLLSEFHEPLATHLSEAPEFSDWSNNIQNDLIDAIGKVLTNEIKSEVKDACFVAISIDESTNVRKKSQLSTVLRYVTKSGDLQERFIEFSEVPASKDRTAEALANHVFAYLKEFNCENKLIAQTYDGASVMPGHLTCLQTKVKEKCSEALLIHCSSNRLNLVLSQAISNIPECNIFFKTLGGFASFFSKSTTSEALDLEIRKRLPSIAPTRWKFNDRLVETVYEYRDEIVSLFRGILANPDCWDNETYNVSRGYDAFLEEFESNFLLVIFSDYFSLTDSLFDTLQKKSSDINLCLTEIAELQINVELKRENFNDFWMKAESIAVNPPSSTRLEVADSVDQKLHYWQLFCEITDNLVEEINKQFDDLARLKFLELINPKKSSQYHQSSFPQSEFDSLKHSYGRFFDHSRLRNELGALYCTNDLKSKEVHSLLKFLLSNELDSAFPQLCLLCKLILTIPVTSVPCEVPVPISALERIKTYSRNPTGQHSSSHLALMSIEKKLLDTFLQDRKDEFYARVIDVFAQKPRSIDLGLTLK